MRTSVVICTYNRADSLAQTLESLRHQHHEDFEVVVVNGPSTDHTPDVLAAWEDRVKLVENPLANLAVSRNLGIRAAAGEIVAFIDDDALPEFDWLAQALPAFADPEVAGVGGIVFDHTGMALQYRFSVVNRFGEAEFRDTMPYDDLCSPGSFLVPYLQGTNALFRRVTLARIGLFDETFDFYLDETDVCIRLVDAGFVLRQLPNAPVHHKYLPSAVRNEERVVTNWFPIIKNFTYFGFRHALDHATELEVIERATAFARRFADDARFHENGGRLPPGSAARCELVAGEAIAIGIVLGREPTSTRPVALGSTPFRAFPTIDSSARRRYVLVSSGHPPTITGGIARYVSEVGSAMAARGHEVRVITRAEAEAGGTVDLEQGVWVHRIDTGRASGPSAIPDGPGYIDAFASGVVDELVRMQSWTRPDVVYGPAWDVEVLGVVRCLPFPVALLLATPLDIVAEQSALLDDPGTAPAIRDLLALERELFRSADVAHADSCAVLNTIAERYGALIDPDRAGVALLGLADRPIPAPPADDARRFLFVGRMEPRKGIDTLLEAFVDVAAGRPDLELAVVGSDGIPPHGDGRTYAERFADDHAGDCLLGQVRFVGRVDEDELEQWHHWADCLVLPSRYESFGLTMLHGMLSHRAVISCAVGAIPEVVRDGVDGLLTPPGDVAALAAAIRRIATEPGLARTLAASGRARFEDTFTIEVSADALIALLERVRLDPDAITRTEGEATLGDVRGFPAVVLGPRAVAHIETDDAAVRHVLVVAPEGAEVSVTSVNGLSHTSMVGDRLCRISIGPRGPVTLTVRSGRAACCGVVSVDSESLP
jgi:glycosyltransferase involved in cell wall biosynthesis/GT2 family glycosyltransferase